MATRQPKASNIQNQREELQSLRMNAAIHDGIQATVLMLSELKIDHMGIGKKLDVIEVQTTKTNGRVDLLEKWRERREGQLSLLMWLAGVTGSASGFVAAKLADILK